MNEHLLPVHWAAARSEYLAGSPVSRVCERYGIPRSTFYQRALDEGWRRDDLRLKTEAVEAPPPEPAPPSWKLSETARARAAQAIMDGRLREAEGWTRLARRLREMALQEDVSRSSWLGVWKAGLEAQTVQDEATCPADAALATPCLDEASSITPDGLDCPEIPAPSLRNHLLLKPPKRRWSASEPWWRRCAPNSCPAMSSTTPSMRPSGPRRRSSGRGWTTWRAAFWVDQVEAASPDSVSVLPTPSPLAGFLKMWYANRNCDIESP